MNDPKIKNWAPPSKIMATYLDTIGRCEINFTNPREQHSTSVGTTLISLILDRVTTPLCVYVLIEKSASGGNQPHFLTKKRVTDIRYVA